MMHFIKQLILIGTIWGCWMTAAMAATQFNQNQLPDTEDAYLVINFKTNISKMDDDAKAMLHDVFDGFMPQAEEKIILVGYTDNVGQSKKNNHLSRQRAQTVREELTKSLGLPPASVLIFGKGEQNPVADNKDARGRSRNRRVEIYLAHMVNGRMMKAIKDKKPQVSRVEALIEEARRHIRMRQLAPAFQTLAKAKAAGADQLSDWHAVYGIAGYYAGITPEKVRAHLAFALRLDAYNSDARAFLGRLDARKKISTGLIPPTSGTTPETAIAISHWEEIYEYLRLLNIQPKTHARLLLQPIEVWTGVDASGQQVNVYFDYAQPLDWAFKPKKTAPPAPIAMSSGPMFPVKSTAQITAQAKEPLMVEKKTPEKIWESEIFR